MKHWFDPQGRTGRVAMVAAVILGWVLVGIVVALVLPYTGRSTFIIALALQLLIAAVPSMRRLHDMGYRAWAALLLFLPPLAGPFLLVIAVWPPQRAANRWGPWPDPARELS